MWKGHSMVNLFSVFFYGLKDLSECDLSSVVETVLCFVYGSAWVRKVRDCVRE